jgi:hypothetical protein
MSAKISPRFWANQQGNFNVVAALMSAPVVAGLTLAYDHARFDNFNQTARTAIDSAIVMCAQDFMTGASDTELDKRAKDYVLANLSSADESASTVDFVKEKSNTGGNRMRLKVKLVYKPLTGPFSAILPAKGEGGETWTFTQ